MLSNAPNAAAVVDRCDLNDKLPPCKHNNYCGKEAAAAWGH